MNWKNKMIDYRRLLKAVKSVFKGICIAIFFLLLIGMLLHSIILIYNNFGFYYGSGYVITLLIGYFIFLEYKYGD